MLPVLPNTASRFVISRASRNEQREQVGRAGRGQAVDAVEHAPVTGQQVPAVLESCAPRLNMLSTRSPIDRDQGHSQAQQHPRRDRLASQSTRQAHPRRQARHACPRRVLPRSCPGSRTARACAARACGRRRIRADVRGGHQHDEEQQQLRPARLDQSRVAGEPTPAGTSTGERRPRRPAPTAARGRRRQPQARDQAHQPIASRRNAISRSPVDVNAHATGPSRDRSRRYRAPARAQVQAARSPPIPRRPRETPRAMTGTAATGGSSVNSPMHERRRARAP